MASSLLVDKGNHRHFMAKEIHEQPEVISHTLANYIDMAEGAVTIPISASIRQLCRAPPMSACGTAYYAGLVGKYWIERYARLPVEIDVASEMRYREPPLSKGGLSLFVSQSGETADTLAVLRHAKAEAQRIAADRQRAHLVHRARIRHRAADARRSRDRRRLHQGVHLPALGARLPGAGPWPRAWGIDAARRSASWCRR